MSCCTKKTKDLLKILCIVSIFVIPIILSYLYYFFGHPRGGITNHGQLIAGVHTVSDLNLDTDLTAVKPNSHNQLSSDPYSKLKWQILFQAPDACDLECEKVLYKLQQVHIALGRNINRLQRTNIHQSVQNINDSWHDLYSKYPHMTAVFTKNSENNTATSKINILEQNKIYLADPLGNIILSYDLRSNNFDTKLFKDTKKLIHLSKIG